MQPRHPINHLRPPEAGDRLYETPSEIAPKVSQSQEQTGKRTSQTPGVQKPTVAGASFGWFLPRPFILRVSTHWDLLLPVQGYKLHHATRFALDTEHHSRIAPRLVDDSYCRGLCVRLGAESSALVPPLGDHLTALL